MAREEDVYQVEVLDCMTFDEIYNLSLECLKESSGEKLNDDNQPEFDQFFNQIFCESYSIKINNKSGVTPRINYATWKEKMKIAQIHCDKKGLKRGNSEYKEAFVQYLYKHIMDAYDNSLTPSGQIKGKNKADTMIVVPNPIRKQKSSLSSDIFDLFPEIMETAEKSSKNRDDAVVKVNHIKSGVSSLMKYIGENVYGIKELDYPKEATNEQLTVIELERYKQLVVFTMIMVGIENVLSVSSDQIVALIDRFAPVSDDGKYDWNMLHRTQSRQNFVENVYSTLRKEKTSSGNKKPSQKRLSA
jgi:hypothetical protein